MRRYLVSGVAIAVLAWLRPDMQAGQSITGQTAPEKQLHGGQVLNMRVPLQRITPTNEMRARWASQRHRTFVGFNERRYGFHSVTLTADIRDFECGRSRQVLDLTLALAARNGVQYWRLPEPGSPANIWDCERGEESVLAVDQGGPIDVSLATPDAQVPIFRVAYQKNYVQHTGYQILDQQLVIDARNRPPKIPARLEGERVDGFCLVEQRRPAADCRWNAGRPDFLCTEWFLGGVRYQWLISGESLPDLPGSANPRDLAGFAGSLLNRPDAVGQWAEPQDVGAVRFLADVPSTQAGRRISLFGASPDLGQPFLVAVRDGMKTAVIPVPSDRSDGQSRAPGYRPSGEPPKMEARTLGRNVNGTSLLQIVAESDGLRTLYHVAIEDTPAQVVAGFIMVAARPQDVKQAFADLDSDSWEEDACDSYHGGFQAPTTVRLAPLTIDYDVERPFKIREQRPWREAEAEASCNVGARASWLLGRFTVMDMSGPCRTGQFRAAYIRPDGSIEIRTLER